VFPVEVRNALLKLERIKRSDPALTSHALDGLSVYQIEMEAPPSPSEYNAILALARREGLSVYDALYLWQAKRKGLTLATRDGALVVAAGSQHVAALDLRR
jgi:predicted nucleic acid-binding protein